MKTAKNILTVEIECVRGGDYVARRAWIGDAEIDIEQAEELVYGLDRFWDKVNRKFVDHYRRDGTAYYDYGTDTFSVRI